MDGRVGRGATVCPAVCRGMCLYGRFELSEMLMELISVRVSHLGRVRSRCQAYWSDLDGGETPSDAIILRTQLSRVESVLSNERSLQKAGKLR